MHKKILLIEDDQVFGNVYRNKLLVEGFQVEIAFDGEAGLEMVRGFRPDAVLLDLMLPKVPGVEVIRKLRLDSDFEALPILVFTNTYLSSIVQDAWKAGATKCLAKADCTPRQVIGALRSILAGDTAGQKPASNPAAPGSVAADTSAPDAEGSAQDSAGMEDSDREFQADLQKSFIGGFPATLSALRMLLQGLIKADNQAGRLQQLQHLCKRVRSITSNAGIVGMCQIAQMSDALEALLRELHEKPSNINASTLRTVASAIDFLGILFERCAEPPQPKIEGRVLVVDDEAISRRALLYALEKAKLDATCVEDPLEALQLLAQSKFDLILLDVHMPNMNGFELCSKLRTLPAYQKTPVVFVTNLNDFESRANSSMSGGNDFIAKPFLFIELAVKALVHVLREQHATLKVNF
jgi:DNA-binding response OmpR family regulator